MWLQKAFKATKLKTSKKKNKGKNNEETIGSYRRYKKHKIEKMDSSIYLPFSY